MRTIILSACALLGVAACATVKVPSDQLERSEATIRGAEEVGAGTIPAARLHLKLAKDQTKAAKAMAADGDKRAVLVLARAECDADLALGLAHEAAAHSAALQAEANLKTIETRNVGK